MTAATKEEIQRAALNALANYPLVAQYVQAGDPRVLAQIGAQAAMLAMVSEQVDVAQFEPFVKARDATVLADASLKGVLPLARACRVMLTLTSTDGADFFVEAGRRFMDAKGRVFEADSWAVVKAGMTAQVSCTQLSRRVILHTAGNVSPFYRIEVDQTDEGLFLNTLQVFKGSDEFTYSPDWFNVLPDALAYQVETDERRKLWVCLGSKGVVGYGAQEGDVFTLKITECEGRIRDLTAGAEFNFEYIYTAQEGRIKASLANLLDEGAAPLTMSELRTIARYPAIYDHNAVYLGEFDYLLRRYITGIRFLSVWNEQIEEAARGPNVASINKLFVSGLVDGMTNAEFETRVRELIRRADNSYAVVFVPTVLTPLDVTVTGQVAVVNDPAAVESQIRAAILGQYDDGRAAVSKGLSKPIRLQAIYRLLRDSVAALQDDASDFSVSVDLPAAPLPEQFLHISAASLTVTIERSAASSGIWSN